MGGKSTGPNPTDRGKGGTKRSLLTDASGVPLSLVVDGANRNDFKMARATLEELAEMMAGRRPLPTDQPDQQPQGLCLDKGYDYQEVRELVAEFGFTAHIRARGEEAQAIKQEAGYKARRWVVERTHSWMNRFRRLLVRWEKKPENYLAMIHFVCAIITLRCAGLFG